MLFFLKLVLFWIYCTVEYDENWDTLGSVYCFKVVLQLYVKTIVLYFGAVKRHYIFFKMLVKLLPWKELGARTESAHMSHQ